MFSPPQAAGSRGLHGAESPAMQLAIRAGGGGAVMAGFAVFWLSAGTISVLLTYFTPGTNTSFTVTRDGDPVGNVEASLWVTVMLVGLIVVWPALYIKGRS
ncbi:MAG: hypothetical protein WBF53_09215 [Litorimonas sp.]